MRIIAGKWRGRPLVSPAGPATRPTSDRAREALFSMLASRLGSFEGLEVVDLFAGSGALGLEALSRGAARCTFVETDRAALEALRGNIAALGATEQADVRAQDATRLSGGPFDLVLLDPPYGSGLGQGALAQLMRSGAIAPGCFVSLETARDESIAIPGLAMVADRTYGKARIRLLRPG
jgi:16S rRNA (guanine966-N2)-methyltransferase